MRNKILKYAFLTLFLLTLSACGFQMYGKENLPAQLHDIYLQSSDPYGTFAVSLKRSLKAAGINLVSTSKEAPITLNIVSAAFIHDNPNITSSSQATIYNFTYTVIFDLRDKTGKTVISQQTVTAFRTLTLNPNEVLEASSEVNIMKGEMERELVMQVFNRLSADNVAKALKASPK